MVVVNGGALDSVVELGLRFCRLGFVDWVWVHGVVVVNGLGLGLPISAWLVLTVGFSGFCRLGLGSQRGGG